MHFSCQCSALDPGRAVRQRHFSRHSPKLTPRSGSIPPRKGRRNLKKTPRRVEKPWGYELIWADTSQYVGKLLHIQAGEALSLQYHEVKDETIHLLKGEMLFSLKILKYQALLEIELLNSFAFNWCLVCFF